MDGWAIENSTSPPAHPTRTNLAYSLAEIIVGAIAIVTNSLDLALILRNRSLRSFQNFCIANQALVNIVLGFLLPLLMTATFLGWPKSFHVCLACFSVMLAFWTTSILCLAVVHLDRFFAILKAALYSKVARGRNQKIVLALPWFLGTAVGTVPLLGWHRDPTGFYVCSYTTVIDLYFIVALNFFGIVIPVLLVLIVCHVCMYREFQHISRRANCCTNDKSKLAKQRQEEMRLLKHLTLILVVFVVCWFPVNIINCIIIWSPATPISADLVHVTMVLSHAHPTVIPVLYARGQARFFRKLLLLVCCGCCVKRQMSSLVSDEAAACVERCAHLAQGPAIVHPTVSFTDLMLIAKRDSGGELLHEQVPEETGSMHDQPGMDDVCEIGSLKSNTSHCSIPLSSEHSSHRLVSCRSCPVPGWWEDSVSQVYSEPCRAHSNL